MEQPLIKYRPRLSIKTNDYENFEKGMIYMKILKKGGGSREKGEEETKSMPHAQTYVYQTNYMLSSKNSNIWIMSLSKIFLLESD
jgi:hypothetical protein